MTDELLLKGLRLRKPAAQERFYKANYKKVRGLCFRILRNIEDAEDAAQQALFQAMSQIDKFKGDSLLTSWLYAITRNESLMILRNIKRYQRKLEAAQQQLTFHTEQTADPINRRTIQKALNNIRPEYKDLLIESLIKSYSGKESAKRKNISHASFKCSLHRARNDLKEAYNEAA